MCALLLGAVAVLAAPKHWSEDEASAEADRDIRKNRIKFYWHGGYAPQPVGVPDKYFHIACRYPHADGGMGCDVSDITFRERQRRYSERYNTRVLSYVLEKH